MVQARKERPETEMKMEGSALEDDHGCDGRTMSEWT